MDFKYDKACSDDPNPRKHVRGYDVYPILCCSVCGADVDLLKLKWCEKAGTVHQPSKDDRCRCELCGQDVHDWAYEYVPSETTESARILTACKRCGFKNPDLERLRNEWEERAARRF